MFTTKTQRPQRNEWQEWQRKSRDRINKICRMNRISSQHSEQSKQTVAFCSFAFNFGGFSFRLLRVFRGGLRSSVFFSFLCVFVVTVLPARAQLQAGAARVSITPDVAARAIPLGGYAARKGARSSGVHDPVYARALVLASGATKTAIVSLDLCFLPANVKSEVAKRLNADRATGLDAAHLFLSATHTHSAPDPLAMHSGNTFGHLKGWTPFDADLLAFTADRITQSIIEANRALVPATLESGSMDEPGANRNRRSDPILDPALTVARVQSKSDGHTLACIVNFAAHPTLYDDKMMQISADWPGVMCGDLEKYYAKLNAGPDAKPGEREPVCLFLNGAEGDASPNGVDDIKSNEEKVTAYGQRMSRLALAALEQTSGANRNGAAVGGSGDVRLAALQAGKSDPQRANVAQSSQGMGLAMWTQTVTLPPRKPNGLFFLAVAQLGATMEQGRDLVNALMPTQTQVTFVRVGSLLLMGVPCEPSGAIGLAAKKLARDAGYKTPAIVALTNDWLAYCLTPEQYKAGKYEAVMSFYGEPFGPTLLDGIKAGLAASPKQTAAISR